MSQETRPWAEMRDSHNQTWVLRITAADALRLRSERTIDLLGTNACRLPSELQGDPVKICEVAFAITKKQRESLGITTEDAFLSLFDGDTFSDLLDATIEAIIDFFPQGRRDAVMKIWNRQKDATAKTEAAIVKRINDPETMATIDQAADEAIAKFDDEIRSLGQTIQ